MAELVYSTAVSKSDPLDRTCLIVGQVPHVKQIKFERLANVLSPRVDEEASENATRTLALVQTTPLDVPDCRRLAPLLVNTEQRVRDVPALAQRRIRRRPAAVRDPTQLGRASARTRARRSVDARRRRRRSGRNYRRRMREAERVRLRVRHSTRLPEIQRQVGKTKENENGHDRFCVRRRRRRRAFERGRGQSHE